MQILNWLDIILNIGSNMKIVFISGTALTVIDFHSFNFEAFMFSFSAFVGVSSITINAKYIEIKWSDKIRVFNECIFWKID